MPIFSFGKVSPFELWFWYSFWFFSIYRSLPCTYVSVRRDKTYKNWNDIASCINRGCVILFSFFPPFIKFYSDPKSWKFYQRLLLCKCSFYVFKFMIWHSHKVKTQVFVITDWQEYYRCAKICNVQFLSCKLCRGTQKMQLNCIFILCKLGEKFKFKSMW